MYGGRKIELNRENILQTKLEQWQNKSFHYGRVDCWRFVSDIAGSISNVNLPSYNDNSYSSLYEGLRFAKKTIGTNRLRDIPSRYFKYQNINSSARGDIVMYKGALGICYGRYSYFLAPSCGLTTVFTFYCKYSWEVN